MQLYDPNYRSHQSVVNWLTALALIAVLIGALVRGHMPDSAEAERALDTAGYTQVTLGDRYNYFPSLEGCSGSDATAIEAAACRPADAKCKNDVTEWHTCLRSGNAGCTMPSNRVNVIVCIGWPFKGATVRTR